MMFSATFNNFSAISWRSVLLVEETVMLRAAFEVHMKAERLGLSEFVYCSCNNTEIS
jgi:hypothetical protein